MRGQLTRVGRRARPAPVSVPPGARRQRARAALVASGEAPALATIYDLTRGTLAERKFYELALESGRTELVVDRWPCDTADLTGIPNVVLHESDAVVAVSDGIVLYAEHAYGWMVVRVAAKARDRCGAVCAAFRQKFPASYLVADDSRIPITFWTNTPHGPMPRLRRIEASGWDGIRDNYTAPVRAELERVMDWQNGPGAKGQLLLWQGPPGTGKTWALRALASRWAPWAEFHYITDPDSFFVHDPSYMVNVLLADSYEALEPQTGEVYNETDPSGKWRILILEDTGELLAANAKDSYGQGLSRLLNVVDGMIGQGLRVLALVTTNDELGELHPAVQRPGRCASALVFAPLSPEEASSWLGSPTGGGTIAELYARRGDALEALESGVDIPAEIARVAAAHQPAEPAYGQAAWNAETATALWIDWDGTSLDEHNAAEAAFLAIPGVQHFVSAAEGIPADEWWDATVVYPEDPPRWVVERSLTAAAVDLTPPSEEQLNEVYEDVLALARSPLPEARPEDFARYQPRRAARGLQADVREVLESLTASGETNRETIAQALAAVAATHQQSMDTIRTLLASSATSGEATRGDALALAALGALDSFARRPDPPAPAAPDVHVHVPKQDLEVKVEGAQIDVHVPAQEAPAPPVVNVTIPDQPAPQVHVAAAPAPEVKVEVAAAPAPDVHVTVEQPAPAPAPRSVRIETDADGVRRFVAED